MCFCNLNTHNVVLCNFLCRTCQHFITINYYVSNILSNVIVFLPKDLTTFSKMQRKMKTCWNSNLNDFRSPSFGEYLNARTLSETPFYSNKVYVNIINANTWRKGFWLAINYINWKARYTENMNFVMFSFINFTLRLNKQI